MTLSIGTECCAEERENIWLSCLVLYTYTSTSQIVDGRNVYDKQNNLKKEIILSFIENSKYLLSLTFRNQNYNRLKHCFHKKS